MDHTAQTIRPRFVDHTVGLRTIRHRCADYTAQVCELYGPGLRTTVYSPGLWTIQPRSADNSAQVCGLYGPGLRTIRTICLYAM
ncbi:hypothetical protein DPMN_140606 [Dreissena polymorpha]|uniref:Uncharacterized protein n=1 Tax=Dreissena polymorpha TaxID=45954 RepID=A0A9D4JLV9_DREPO|nr:hypothetical protein DPMN_140606 [Dreissena polymorpha]